ncbi:helix-turn-helix domain-containing protein [Chloroflexota bacterium]
MESPMEHREHSPSTMTVEEAAKVLSISRGLAYEMVRQGKIPALRFGRVIRVPRHALEQLLNLQDQESKKDEV